MCRYLGCGRVARSVPRCLDSLQMACIDFLQSGAAVDGLPIGPDMVVTDLEYVDDFCLVSATADGLLRITEVAALWCDAVGLLPSSDKTVVMEMTGRQSADGSWSCGRRALRQVSEVR